MKLFLHVGDGHPFEIRDAGNTLELARLLKLGASMDFIVESMPGDVEVLDRRAVSRVVVCLGEQRYYAGGWLTSNDVWSDVARIAGGSSEPGGER